MIINNATTDINIFHFILGHIIITLPLLAAIVYGLNIFITSLIVNIVEDAGFRNLLIAIIVVYGSIAYYLWNS
jgi:uncharacterized membrane protein YdjX (TVP38/TMEM64 family)